MAIDVELLLDGVWTSARSRIRYEAGIEVERGRDAEANFSTSQLSFVGDNRDLWWSGDVPGTTNYGKIRRTTPIRARDTQILDSFTRSESSGWGTCETPSVPWEIGSGSASDYSVTSGAGRHTLTTTATTRQTRIELTLRASMVLVSVTIGATAATAAARASAVLRKTADGSAHYRAELEFTTSGTVTANLVRLGGPGTSTLDTAAAGSYSGGDKWWIRFMAVGSQLYMSAWADGDTEPADWLCTAEDVHFRRGQLALRSVRDSGNTNSNLTMDFDDLELSEPRFFGEIWSLRPMADKSGRDLTMTVEASGLFRRLSNTAKPIRSALYGALSTGDFLGFPPVAYWPCEDGDNATQLEQVIVGAGPGRTAGPVDMGSDSTLPGSAPLPQVSAGGVLSGTIPAFTSFDPTTDFWTVLWLMKIDEAPEDETVLLRFGAGENVAGYEVAMDSDGVLLFRGPKLFQLLIADAFVFSEFDPYDIVHDNNPTQPSLWGEWVSFMMYNDPTTDTIGLQWSHATADANAASLSYSDAAYTWYQPDGLWTLYGPAAYGHVAVFDNIAAFTFDETSGYAGESARTRFSRLCSQQGIEVETRGSDAEPMGPQKVDTLVANLEECQSTDLGIAREARHVLGLEYFSHGHRYNQLPAATLDIAGRTIAEGLDPVRDDQNVATSVTATRDGGSPQMYTVPEDDVFHLTSGTEAGEGIDPVGLVEASISPNVETDRRASSQASWHAHLRATKDPRFEELMVKLNAPTFRNDPQLAIDVAGLVEGDVLRLTNPPSWMHPSVIELQVQGIREYTCTRRTSAGVKQTMRELTFNLTPGFPWEVWPLDTGGSVISVAKDDDDTSLTVETSLGPEWKTSPDPPFAIQAMTGGEAMLVTGCTTATPAFIAAGTVAHANNASVAPALPAGITADTGQLLVMVAAIRNSGAGTPDLPSGWTSLAWNGNLRVFARYYVTGVTAPTVTFTGGVANADTTAQICAFSGTSIRLGCGLTSATLSAGKESPVPATQSNSSGQNIGTPALRVHRDNSVVLYVGWKQDDWTSVVSPGDAEIGEPDTTTGDDQGVVWSYDIQTTATDIVANSFAVSGGVSAISKGFVLALRPLQTMTVERSLNGVVGSLVAHESLHVYRHGVVAL